MNLKLRASQTVLASFFLLSIGCAHSKKAEEAKPGSAASASNSAPKAETSAEPAMPATIAAFTPPKPKYGPPGKPIATPLSLANSYLRSPKIRSPDFWAMIGYYVPQDTDTCTASSLSVVLNALLIQEKKTADWKNITPKELMDTITSPGWTRSAVNAARKAGDKEAMAAAEREIIEKKLHNCATLTEYEGIATEALEWKGIKAKVRRVHISPDVLKDRNSPAYKKARMKFVQDLIANEATADNFIIANYNQKATTDDADAGHISPIGAFNPFTEKVLILDPDREYYEPYWVSVDALMTGMGTLTDGGEKPRGYLFIQRTSGNAPAAADESSEATEQ